MRLILSISLLMIFAIFLKYLYVRFPMEYYDVIENMARDLNLDPLLVMAIVKVESDFDPSAVSHAGAIGLMQVMPKTARWISEDLNPKIPEENLRLGILYLRYLLDEFEGDLEKALMAYNVGPNALKNGEKLSHARKYFKRIRYAHLMYRILYWRL